MANRALIAGAAVSRHAARAASAALLAPVRCALPGTTGVARRLSLQAPALRTRLSDGAPRRPVGARSFAAAGGEVAVISSLKDFESAMDANKSKLVAAYHTAAW